MPLSHLLQMVLTVLLAQALQHRRYCLLTRNHGFVAAGLVPCRSCTRTHGCSSCDGEACCTDASPLLVCCRCSTFSSIPLPGDDQQGLIYSALHNSDDAAAAALKIEAAANKEKGEAAEGNGADPSNPNPGPSKGRVPHRWQVVGMMGLAFVLCNMDKVGQCVWHGPFIQGLPP